MLQGLAYRQGNRDLTTESIGTGKGSCDASTCTTTNTDDEFLRSDALYRAVVETCQDGFWLLDENSRIVVVNDAYLKLTGYRRDEVLGLSPWDFEDGCQTQAVREHIAQITADGTAYFSTWHRAKDGRRVCLEVISTASRAMRCGFVFSRDVSERQRAAIELRESEARFRDTFEQAAVGMAHIGLDGRWLRVNRKLCAILGYPEAELLAMGSRDLTHPDDVGDYGEHVHGMLAGELDSCAFETRYIAKTGTPVWTNVTTTLARDGCGAPMYFISVIEDITQRKSVEAELAALRRKLENITKLEVAAHTVAALAHELNQPLMAVSAYAKGALGLLRSDNPQRSKLDHALEMAAQEAQRSGRVLHDLLTFLRQGEVELETFDLADMARRVVEECKAHHDGLRFTQHLAPQMPVVRANGLQIQKVLANLIENGIDAMRDAGSAGPAIVLTLRAAADGGMAHVTVSDNGPGIDREMLDRIFDTFFTTKPDGLGLGLAISRTIVESHGGRLWVESEPGGGARFHFTLPYAE